MLSAIMLSVIMLNVVMLSVIMLKVVAPNFYDGSYHLPFCPLNSFKVPPVLNSN